VAFGRALRLGPAPLGTLARIAYLAVFYRLTLRHTWPNRLSDAVATWRRARRGHPGGPRGPAGAGAR
jgi:hypothetical protein